MKTTMILPEALYVAAKVRAAQERRGLKDLVTDAVRLYLRTVKAPTAEAKS